MSINIRCKDIHNVDEDIKTEFNITLNKRITCIVGDSGTGKTHLCNLLDVWLRGLKIYKDETDIIREHEVFGEILKITENNEYMRRGTVRVFNATNRENFQSLIKRNLIDYKLIIIDNAMDVIDRETAKIIAEDTNTAYLIMGRSDLCEYLDSSNYAELMRNGTEVKLIYTGRR